MISNAKTQLHLLIGQPIGHSLSPLLHQCLYANHKINAVLLAHESNDLTQSVEAIKTLGVPLTAVTLPYKETVISFLDTCHKDAKRLGAVNTIIQRDGKLHGYNTDITGIAYAFRNTEVKHKNVLVLGAGGAARAVVDYLHQQQAHIYILNRNVEKAHVLAQAYQATVVAQATDIHADIIINATPLGMAPHTEVSPLPDYQFDAHQCVFDMIYNPKVTLLQKQALAANAKLISGLDMFIRQGIQQVELLLDKTIPILPAYKNTLVEAL